MLFLRNKYFGLHILIFLVLAFFIRIPGMMVLGQEVDNFISMINEEWRWVQFTTESGLPSNDIEYIEEARDGTMWVGTKAGLAWYDGYVWHKIDSTYGIPHQPIYSMNKYKEDQIIVGFRDHSIYYGNKIGFKKVEVWKYGGEAIPYDSNILLHVNTEMFIYNPDGNFLKMEGPMGLSGWNECRNLWYTKGLNIWLNTDSGLFRWDKKSWILKMKASNQSMYINFLIEDSNGTGLVSIGSPNEQRGLWSWSKDHILRKDDLSSGDWIKGMDINSKGIILLIDKSGESYFKEGGKFKKNTYHHEYLRGGNFIKFSSNDDIFVGGKEGLYLFKNKTKYWSSKKNPLSVTNRVHEVIKKKDGSLWLATAEGLEVHSTNGKLTSINEIMGSKLFNITGLIEDDKGRIWCSSGSAFNGAYCWDGSEWVYYRMDTNYAWLRFHKIKKDRRGRLWFCGLSKTSTDKRDEQPGVYIFEGNIFSQWRHSSGLNSQRVYSFAEGLDSTYWFATQKGICAFKNLKWKYWQGGIDIPFRNIFTLTSDNKKGVWFSDRMNGLGHIDEGGNVEIFKSNDGLPDNRVWDISCDEKNRIWVTTEAGLCSYDHGKWKVFDAKTGLMTPDLWPVLPVGDSVYVGTRGGGLAILNLRNSYQKTPKIFIDNAIVEGNKAAVRVRPYAYWGDPQPHDIPIRYSIDNQKWTTWSNNHEVVLTDQTPGDHAIHVEAQNIFGEFELRGKLMYFSVPPPMQQMPQFYLPIGGLSFVLLFVLTEYFVRKKYYTRELQKSETKFRKLTESIFEGIVIHELDVIRDANNNMTRMFGYTIDELQRKSLYDLFDNDYIDVVKSMVEYPSSKSVEAMGIRSNGSRLWTEIVTTASVHPEYTYTVTAFRDISDRKNAEHKLVTYKNQLRSLASELTTTEERERRRIAAFLHDTISQTLAFCKIKLRSIDLSRQSESVEKSLIHVRSLIDEMIQSTRSLTFELSPPILYEVGFEAAVHSLIEQLQQQHNLSFVLIDDHISKPLDNESRIILYQAVRELIANVIKHAHANTVKITFKKENNMFRVTVEDDGVGMKTSTNSDESTHQGGFGLFNIRERLQTRGGSLEIITEIKHGTKISIVVPLRNHEK